MAQTDIVSNPGIFDNEVLDEFEVPFGDWMDQSVDWIDVNLDWLLKAMEWPFSTLLDLVVTDVLIKLSWVWVVLAFFVIGSLVRNVKVGFGSALGLAACGILGNAYWLETARTIGFIFVSVVLCVIVGIPIGVACGRVDGVWKVVRPILDAMQVVHSFVYMLPFIFFFGIGSVSATMVTMVFAVPPLIRLTNLGIRQVPEDVVEASRAYGAPEWRVLVDVQLPLARPAIMTGLNQTLLLAISMLGIAAIMGAGGLGQLLFRALSNQDVSFATSGGLAFFLVAVVLDRITQGEESGSGSLGHRLRRAWVHRQDPGELIPDGAEAKQEDKGASWEFARVGAEERKWMTLTAVGSVIAIVSVFLTWTNDGSKIGGFGRRIDEIYEGETSFSGLAAEGGSWFGFITIGLAVFVLAAVVVALNAPGKGPRWMTTDGAVIASVAMLLSNLGYLLAWSPDLGAHSTGIGVWIAVIGSLVAAVGSILWITVAPHSPLHPLGADVTWGRVFGVSIAVVVLFIASVSGWSFDGRQDVIITPELQAQIDDLQQQARDNPADAGPIAARLSALMSTAAADDSIVISGVNGAGSGLGIWTLVFGALGLAVALPAAGLLGTEPHKLWLWSTVTAGVGTGVALIAVGWIATLVRSADPNYVSGIGSFLALCGGSFIVVSSGGVLKEFRRTKVYDDEPAEVDVTESTADVAQEAAEELV